MSVKAVRFGRYPKLEKAKILAVMQNARDRFQEKSLDAELEDDIRVSTTIVRAHEETCEYAKDKAIALVDKACNKPVYTQCPSQLACPLIPAPHILDNGAPCYIEDFFETFAPAIKGVVEFIKRIPGFRFLSQDDQDSLLKDGIFEVLFVRLTYVFDTQANLLIRLNGQMLRKDSLYNDSNTRFLLNLMFNFAEGLNNLQLSDEVGLFCAVVATASDRPGLRNTDLVRKVEQKMKHILKIAVFTNNRKNPNIFEDLMKKIPDLHTLNTLHSEKLLEYRTRTCNSRAAGAIDGITDNSVNNQSPYTAILHDMNSTYSRVSTHIQCLASEKDLISTSPGQHNQDGGSTRGSEWNTTDFKGEHYLVGSPRTISSGFCVDDVKSPVRKFSNSRSHAKEETWHATAIQNMVKYHHTLRKKDFENPGSEQRCSSGYASYFSDIPTKGLFYPNLSSTNYLTDSVFPHFRCYGSSTTPTLSVCSNPRSSVDERVKDMDPDHASENQEAIENMPVLKRALQSLPIINPYDEVYRHHKKFGAVRREAKGPGSPSQITLASTHRPLLRTLEAEQKNIS